MHPSRFVFLNRPVTLDWVRVPRGRAVVIGEQERSGGLIVYCPTVAGGFSVEASALSRVPMKGAAPMTVHPTDLEVWATVDGKWLRVGGPWDERPSDGPPVKDPEFLKIMDPNDPEFGKIVAASDKFWACFNKELSRLDPDGRRGDCDLITSSRRTGETVKVESYAAVLERKACKTCGCAAQQRRNATASHGVLKPLRDKAAAGLQPVAVRLAALFPGK